MQIETSKINGIALDWAITSIENPEALRFGLQDWREQRCHTQVHGEYICRFHQSWNQSYDLIERERVNMGYNDAGQAVAWKGSISDYDTAQMFHGDNTLIAALRCICAHHFGEFIQIPDEFQ